MPGKPRQIVAEAERQFPIRIIIKMPEAGIGARYTGITDWLDENCGMGNWSLCPAGTRGILNDAVAVYVNTPVCGVGFAARWCVPVIRRGSMTCGLMIPHDSYRDRAIARLYVVHRRRRRCARSTMPGSAISAR